MDTSVKRSMACCRLGVVALALIASSHAVADDDGWYLGANAGESRANIDNPRITSGLLSEGFDVTTLRDQDNHFGYKLFGGYQFLEYFALEGGYFDLGRFGFDARTLPPGGLAGDLKLRGANLDALGIVPFTQKFAAFARIGYDYASTKDNFAGSGAVVVPEPERSAHSSNYKVAVAQQPAPPVQEAAPAPVVQEAPPPPPPVVIAAPIMPEMQRYCSILETHFDINRDVIERAERERFVVLATFMKKYPQATALIEGHTDNVGSDAANMKLSQRRADSVVNYLVDSLHIDRSRLNAIGYGATRPLASNNTEEGKRLNRQTIAVVTCATDVEGLKVQPARVTMALRIEFERNMDSIQPQYHDDLQNVAAFLKANPTVTATVEGHTANVQATPQLAMEISQRRAQSVVNYLADNFGIERSRLRAEGFGDSRRFAYNTSSEGQQENRRVNIIIDYPRK
jgi:OOP family OmpA-OmpF porin